MPDILFILGVFKTSGLLFKTVKISLLVWLLLCSSFLSLAQEKEKFTLSGQVRAAESNESLINVTVFIPELNTGVSTNKYGFYSVSLESGTYTLEISSIGYRNHKEIVDLSENQRLDVFLETYVEELQEVVITENIEELSIRNPQMSINALSLETIRDIPLVFGEADVVSSILLLPGVSNAGEGSTGFNVRGGAADQNLILLDEAMIYNPSHLFGFFSVFNPDAIKDVTLYKGGIPARYGGRASSVLEVYQKEGNSKEYKISGGIGTIASRLMAEGPIVKDRSAFLLGGRASYGQYFLPVLDIDNSAYFYDLNAKLHYEFNERNKIYLSGYFGRDSFSLDGNYANTYGNTVVNLRWNHLFSEKLFSNLSFIYTDYFFGLDLDLERFRWDSNVRQLNLKFDLNSFQNEKVSTRYGFHNIYYEFNPGTVNPLGPDSEIERRQLTRKYADELAAYVDIENYISEKFSLQYGARVSLFMRLAQGDYYRYKNDDPVLFDPFLLTYVEAEPIFEDNGAPDYFSDGIGTGISQVYANLEPRLSMAYRFNPDTSLKASYNRIAQYVHLLSNTSSPSPVDVWTPSGPYIKPQIADQYALGFYKNFKSSLFSLETEVFYKDIANRIDYIDGADLIANEAIERVILNGEARAYGAELFLRLHGDRFRGWLAYTYSRSEQRTPGRTPKVDNNRSNRETGINLGQWYSTPYDKPHDLSIFVSYLPDRRWTFSANFVYQTGRPTNYPLGQFEFQGLAVPYYGLRNTERLPDYHRLDLSAKLVPRTNRDRNWQAEWVFSIYNVYDRKNAASINFRQNQDTGANEAVRTAIFGIVPSVTYNFKF